MPRSAARKRGLFLAVISILIIGGAAAGAVLWAHWPSARPLQVATSAYAHQAWPAAEKAAREHLKIHRDDIAALRLLARCLYRQGRDELAADIHTRVPDDQLEAEDYLLVGQALKGKGQMERAIFVWRKAVELDSRHLETLVPLVQLLLRQDQLHEAASRAEQLAREPAWQARAFVLLGRIRAEQGDLPAAALAYQHALARSDEWHGFDAPEDARKQLARCLLASERSALARDELVKLPDAERDPEASWLLARCDLQQGKTTPAQVLALGRAYREAHLLEPEPAAFVGGSQCARCHKAIYQSQHASRHAHTFVPTGQLAEVAVPASPVSEPGNPHVTHEFRKGASELGARTRVGAAALETIFDYAFGSRDRGLTLVGHDRNNQYYEYRLSSYPAPAGWDVTSGHPARPASPAFSYQGMLINQDAVRRCLVCHATSAQAVRMDSGPVASDSGIGCERCHGPGGNHLIAVSRKDDDLAIARPALVFGPPLLSLCAGCHSPRSLDMRLSPGADDSVRFQGTTLTWSRCYTESSNRLDCVTCHNPHRNAETSRDWYVSRCLACHVSPQNRSGRLASNPSGTAGRAGDASYSDTSNPRRATLAAKTTCPVNASSNCIDCHMPKVTSSMSHTLFTDHFIRIHSHE
jgi:tetratricopeptide (TPR) repeat protein